MNKEPDWFVKASLENYDDLLPGEKIIPPYKPSVTERLDKLEQDVNRTLGALDKLVELLKVLDAWADNLEGRVNALDDRMEEKRATQLKQRNEMYKGGLV